MNITAAILCGGQGTRLRPVIGDLPKCLALVRNEPFIRYILEHLRTQGIKNVVLCTGYNGKELWEKFVQYYLKIPPEVHVTTDGMVLHSGELRIVESREPEPLGTGGALRHALPLLDSDPVLVLNGDTFCKFDLASLISDYNGWAIDLSCDGNAIGSSGVRLVSQRLLKSIPEKSDIFSGMCGQIVVYDDWKFHDIGTPEGYAGAEAFLRQQGVIA